MIRLLEKLGFSDDTKEDAQYLPISKDYSEIVTSPKVKAVMTMREKELALFKAYGINRVLINNPIEEVSEEE